MILPIYLYGQPVLRKTATDIDADYPDLQELIKNMFETMWNAEGIGLAAPQIGLPIRLVVSTSTLSPMKIPNSRSSAASTSMHTSLRPPKRQNQWKRAV